MTLADRYPILHTPSRWEWGGMDVVFSTDPPPDELITNIHVICFAGDRIVLCRDDRDVWLVPGGTREAGEAIEECVIRELREEAGARLVGELHWLGAHYATSDREEPYKEWQPHPHKAWLWCSAEVVVEDSPTSPDDAEQILEVRAVSFEEAIRLAGTDGAHMSELVRLAVELRGGQVDQS